MVGSKEGDAGSLHAPLLGNYSDDNSRLSRLANNDTQEHDEAEFLVEDNFDRCSSTTTVPTRLEEPVLLASIGNHHQVVNNKSDDEPLASQVVDLVAGNRNPFHQIQDAHASRSTRGHKSSRLHPAVDAERRHEAAAATTTSQHPARHGSASSTTRSLRNPLKQKSFVVRAARSARSDPKSFLFTVLQGVILWPKWSWAAVAANSSLTILSLKQGFLAGLASILCVIPFPDPFGELNSIALWAVVTTDLLLEGNIGLSVSKGFNRVLGTLAAGLIALALNEIGSLLGYQIYPYFMVFIVMFGGAVFRFLKGIPPLKDQWGYAFTVATIAFHLFIITAYTQPERWTLPMLRFSMILLGFFMSTLVNLAIKPIYAGDTLHKLVAKNFETAASVIQRCVEEYIKDTKLDHVPDILCGLSVDDKIHQSYHEVVMSDSDVDKLLSAVHWEPCHGPFFRGYPWDLYDDITDYLRYTLYDVIALDSCLRANIQAPKNLRELFAKLEQLKKSVESQLGSSLLFMMKDMEIIAKECASVLQTLGNSIKNMEKFASNDIMRKAQEAAVLLQYKIYLHTHLLLGSGAPKSPRYPLYMASVSPFSNMQPRELSQDHNSSFPRSWTGAQQYSTSDHWKADDNNGKETFLGEVDEGAAHGSSVVGEYGPIETEEHDDLVGVKIGSLGKPPMYGSWSQGTSKNHMDSRFGKLKLRDNPVPTWQDDTSGVVISIPDGQLSRSLPDRETPQLEGIPIPGKSTPGPIRQVRWQEQFMQRRYSLGRNWDGSLERISALSLVKFASLLIEIVSKLNYVVESVENLSQKARFKELATE